LCYETNHENILQALLDTEAAMGNIQAQKYLIRPTTNHKQVAMAATTNN